MIDNIYSSIKKRKAQILHTVDKAHDYFLSFCNARYDREHISHYITKDCKLTSSERRLIREKFGRIIPDVRIGYDFFTALKSLDRFDVRYVPSGYFFPYIVRTLNPDRFKQLLAHKSLLPLIHETDIQQPETPLKSIAGVFFNSHNKPISPAEAARIVSELNTPLMYKPSTDSSYGHGIKLFEEKELSNLASEIKDLSILDQSKTDFVLQIPVRQSEQTKIFNPTSLNCMRVTTLNLNGKVTTDSITLKCGPTGAVVDNIGNGKRGVIVGVSQNGNLASHGFYGDGEKCFEHNGIRFEGQTIPDIHKVVNAAIVLHKQIDFCHVIGWDIALDENDNPVLIEGNTNNPGISLEQMCSGPVFGNRIDEVIEFIIHKK
ncbi:MAG: hypothetical protein HDR95_02950 [Bacteroides sp.]|nr:hypothetical protein [Bacteroides sp.]